MPSGQRGGSGDAGAARASRTARARPRTRRRANGRVVGVGRAEHPARRASRRRARRRARPRRRAARRGRRRRRARPASRTMPAVQLVRSRRRRLRATCTYARSVDEEADRVGAGLREVAPHRVAERVVAVDARAAARRARRSRRGASRTREGRPRVERLGRHGAEGTLRPWPVPEVRRRARTRSSSCSQELYPDARCALKHTNAYQLLVATILSAQCTDERVNMVTPALFARYPTPADLAAADPDEVEELVRSTGFFRSKTKNLIGMAQAVEERFGGEIPTELADLVTLPGRRAQDRQRRAVGVVRPARPAGRHARDPAVAPAAAHQRDRPGEDRGRPRRDGAARGVGAALAAADRARPPGVRRAQAPLRRVRASPASARRPASSAERPDASVRRRVSSCRRGSRGRGRASGGRRSAPRSAP